MRFGTPFWKKMKKGETTHLHDTKMGEGKRGENRGGKKNTEWNALSRRKEGERSVATSITKKEKMF